MIKVILAFSLLGCTSVFAQQPYISMTGGGGSVKDRELLADLQLSQGTKKILPRLEKFLVGFASSSLVFESKDLDFSVITRFTKTKNGSYQVTTSRFSPKNQSTASKEAKACFTAGTNFKARYNCYKQFYSEIQSSAVSKNLAKAISSEFAEAVQSISYQSIWLVKAIQQALVNPWPTDSWVDVKDPWQWPLRAQGYTPDLNSETYWSKSLDLKSPEVQEARKFFAAAEALEQKALFYASSQQHCIIDDAKTDALAGTKNENAYRGPVLLTWNEADQFGLAICNNKPGTTSHEELYKLLEDMGLTYFNGYWGTK